MSVRCIVFVSHTEILSYRIFLPFRIESRKKTSSFSRTTHKIHILICSLKRKHSLTVIIMPGAITVESTSTLSSNANLPHSRERR